MKITVIIPSRNRYPNLVQVVDSLVYQTFPKEDYEIIISDDNSTDDTFNVYKAVRDAVHCKYINNNTKPHSWNASVPRNLGALIADPTTTHLLFVDSDVVLPNTALKNYSDDIDQNPNRVIIGPYDFYKQDNETINIKDVRSLKFEEVTVDQTFNSVHDGLATFGGNLLIPKTIFWSVGGFSPEIAIGLEDGDIGLKLWKVGAQFSYDKRTRGKHLWHEVPPDRFPPDMADHIDRLNMKHFHVHTKDADYGIIEASREAYASWGIEGWEAPAEWKADKLNFMLKVKR